MSRLTLRLPETLHQQLTQLAEDEGVSLNQYIVYALTRQAVSSHTIQLIPRTVIERQQQEFQQLIQHLGTAASAEITSALAEREPTEPEADLDVDVIERLQKRIRKKG